MVRNVSLLLPLAHTSQHFIVLDLASHENTKIVSSAILSKGCSFYLTFCVVGLQLEL